MTHPKLICIGADEAGAHWIQDQFNAHSDFWAPPLRNISFFDLKFGAERITEAEQQLNWKMPKHGAFEADFTHDISFLLRIVHGRPRPQKNDFDAYFALFAGRPGHVADCSAGYVDVARQMAAEMVLQMPETAFVIVVRNPVEQIWARLQTSVDGAPLPDLSAYEDPSQFDILVAPDAIQRFFGLHKSIAAWQGLDHGNRLLTIDYDDLLRDPQATRDRIATHAGADIAGFTGSPAFDAAAHPPMPDVFRLYLEEKLAAASSGSPL